MKRVQIILGSESDLPIVENGLAELEALSIGYSLRIASAHRSPDFVHGIVSEFESAGGEVLMCVAGKSAHLAGVVASLTVKPVIAVPVYSKETAGFDSLLSMGQMPKGIPVATMGFGNSGFINGCLLAAQMIALGDEQVATSLKQHRISMTEKVIESDRANSREFDE